MENPAFKKRKLKRLMTKKKIEKSIKRHERKLGIGVVFCILTLALCGPAFAQSGIIFDPTKRSFDPNLDTEVTKELNDLLPDDSYYQSSWNPHTFQDSQTGISGSLFLIGGVSTHRDSTGNIGTTYDYGSGVTTYRDSTGNIGTTFDYGDGMTTYRDSTGSIGTIYDYGNGVTIHRDSTGNIDTTFDYDDGYKTYQFTRPPLTRPDERD